VWGNKTFANSEEVKAARVYVKLKDANNPDFVRFLDQHEFRVNKDRIQFGRAKSVLQLVVTGLGVFGLLVVLLALMLFSFYLQLIIARSKESLLLLITLGYSPSWLTKIVSGKWIPTYIIIVLVALAITAILQRGFYSLTASLNATVSPFIHWSVLLLSLLLILSIAFTNYRLVRKQLHNL
jgi:ABC-type lipoprotein release transport system permease subunit